MIRINFKVLNLIIFGSIQIHFRFHHKIVVNSFMNSFRGMTTRLQINFLKITHNMEIILIFIFKISEFNNTQKLSTNLQIKLSIINIFRVVSSALMIVLNLNYKNHLKHYPIILLFHLHPVHLLVLQNNLKVKTNHNLVNLFKSRILINKNRLILNQF